MKLLTFTILFNIILVLHSQVSRQTLHFMSTSQKTALATQMHNYISAEVIEQHCDMKMLTGGDIHSDFDFLPFHRGYLQDMEDYLFLNGAKQHVPLPLWDPADQSLPLPTQFRTLDNDCINAICPQSNHLQKCTTQLSTFSTIISVPDYLKHLIKAGNNNDLCDWQMNPTSPSTQDCCPSGLSAIIEGSTYRLATYPAPLNTSANVYYHDQTHTDLGGVMNSMVSPTSLAFWLFHAQVDQIWRHWEYYCSNSTLPNIDLFMKDHPYTQLSERDLGDEPSIYNDAQYLFL
jgi:hypothetical protein